MKTPLFAGLLFGLLAALPARAELHVVTIYAHDTGFEAPDRVPSGPTTLRFVNRGWKPHRMQVVRLDDAVDDATLRAALPLGEETLAGISSLGGTGVHRGEGREAISVALRPGRYALVCDLHEGPAEIHEIQVLDYEDPTLPSGDWSVRLGDDGVQAPSALAAGARWLRVENGGTHPSGLDVGRLRPGRSAAEARTWAQAPSGPRPWVRVGGTAPISPGEVLLIELAMPAGDYVLFAPSRDGEARPDRFWHALAVRQER